MLDLSQKRLKDDPHHLTPTSASSGITMSFKTPGGDKEDMKSLDGVPDVGC